MVFIEPSVELIKEENPYKKIELAGRTCYKSESKITEDSSVKFVKGLIKRMHYAMLEHQIFIFEVYDNSLNKSYVNFLKKFKYLNVTESLVNEKGNFKYRYLVSGNVRALCERNVNDPIFDLLHEEYPDLCFGAGLVAGKIFNDYDAYFFDINEHLDNITINEFLNHVYYTFRIITDRGVTHELVRHRVCSFAQESTRYVNYKDGLSIALPANFYSRDPNAQAIYQYAFEEAEKCYQELIDKYNEPPQQARAVLPTALKTEIILTTNLEELIHILNLRYKGTTGNPHPDIKVVAEKMYNLIINNFYDTKINIKDILDFDSNLMELVKATNGKVYCES